MIKRYPTLLKETIKKFIDKNYNGPDVATETIFKDLLKKFEVFFIFPNKVCDIFFYLFQMIKIVFDFF